MTRPTHKELSGKIKAATRAVKQVNVRYIDPLTIAVDAIELGYDFENNIFMILSDLLSVITPADYTGSRPPQRSYELVIKDMDLFAFTVQGSILVDVVYLKFSIKKDYFYIASLHKNR